MSKKILSLDLLSNAQDSFSLGINFYLEKSEPTYLKHTVLNVFHAIELFLKARLAKVHPALIYADIDKPITENSFTVSFMDSLERLKNLHVGFSKEELHSLKYLRNTRNLITHHEFKLDSDQVEAYLSKSLAFLDTFLRVELSTSYNIFLDEKKHELLKEALYDYTNRKKQIQDKIDKDFSEEIESLALETCSACGEVTIPVLESLIDKETECYFCNKKWGVYSCHSCGKPSVGGLCDKCEVGLIRAKKDYFTYLIKGIER